LIADSVLPVFLVVFREALEASLIIGIILTALVHLGQTRYIKHVLMSVAAALIASILAGFGLQMITEAAQGQVEKFIEGFVSIIACCILTYMIFWMEQEAHKIKSQLVVKVEESVTRGEYIAILTLPFLAVFREGAETVLFLNAIQAQTSSTISIVGGAAGLLLGVLVVCLIFVGGRRIPLKPLFQWSGYFLLFVAAGLLAYGIHELQEVGVIVTFVYPVYDINWLLDDKTGVGSFLKALFGYNGNPSLIEVMAYLTYILGVLYVLREKLAANS